MIAATCLLAALMQVAASTGLAPPQYVPPTDPRIQTVEYRADQVTPLRMAPGYAAVVEFAADEQIENVVLGDTAGWQVTPNHAGDRLVVQPLASSSMTNMVVLTNARRYVFLLQGGSDPSQAAFALRFVYPSLASAGPTEPPHRTAYKLNGSRSLFPLAMVDDGTRTIVTWASSTPIPAIFAVDDHGRENLVNARMVDRDYVIEGVASRYVLRRAHDKAVATRVMGEHR